jgi:hypothetical protein
VHCLLSTTESTERASDLAGGFKENHRYAENYEAFSRGILDIPSALCNKSNLPRISIREGSLWEGSLTYEAQICVFQGSEETACYRFVGSQTFWGM